MQRSTTVALGVLFLVCVALALLISRSSRYARPAQAPSAKSSASATPSARTPAPAASLENAVEAALAPEEGSSEGFDVLPDGRKAPPLPDSAPQTVTFGVIQFSYDGAQFANKGNRSKQQAKAKAQGIVEQARLDFAAAVAKGDRGSTANAGRMPRGILEPAVEYLLFSLPKGGVHADPVDTPRGYWVIRRID